CFFRNKQRTNRVFKLFRCKVILCQSDVKMNGNFKTPTRIQRPRAVSAESPHNDSDFQQDIIWDATSPSPNRLACIHTVAVPLLVSLKHGRPTVAEPTLQQWIGDSATIPCTPDVQVPRTKKKSPRPNGVDDLLKLAKQFDFNMFHQDEDANDFSISPPGNRPPATKATVDAQPHADQHMEDDLDFLFDAPTQHVSGNLSQMASTAPPASGKPSASSLPPPHGVPTTHARKGASAHTDEFEDDWANDDFLNDSLVLEMTQNPQNFVAPKHCSTQKTPIVQSAVSNVEKDNVRQRTTFKLESNPSFSVGRIPTDTWATSKVDSGLKKSENGARLTSAPFPQRTSVPRNNTAASSHSTAANAAGSFPASPAVVSSRGGAAPAVSDVPDEDLSPFFSSEPAWDDPADDDLLCEMCDDLENQIQSAESVPATRALPAHQRAALQPSNRKLPPANQQAFPRQKQTLTPTTRLPAGPSLAAVSYVTATDSFRCTQAKNTSSASPLDGNPASVLCVFSAVVGKCSAAEIELKKQQAMERRRQRLLAAGNLRAPT
uniref:ETAA1 activator of ATR kinase n=1 Tax=Sander lucioperca TaxID=283035 RepID=A0A8C9XUG7_SANLU